MDKLLTFITNLFYFFMVLFIYGDNDKNKNQLKIKLQVERLINKAFILYNLYTQSFVGILKKHISHLLKSFEIHKLTQYSQKSYIYTELERLSMVTDEWTPFVLYTNSDIRFFFSHQSSSRDKRHVTYYVKPSQNKI